MGDLVEPSSDVHDGSQAVRCDFRVAGSAATTTPCAAGRTDLPPDLARSVAADLLAEAFCTRSVWMPLWYELGLAGADAPVDLVQCEPMTCTFRRRPS